MYRKMVAAAIFFIILFGGFHFIKSISENEQQWDKTIMVGWIGPLSGPAKALGLDNLNAVKLALIEYESNKRKSDPDILLTVFDDEYNVEKSKEAYTKLVSDIHKKVIMISTYSGVIALADNALSDSVLLIDPLDNDKQLASINKNIFTIAKESEGLAGILANSLIDHEKKKVAVFYYDDDGFMPNLAHSLQEMLVKNKLHIDLYMHHRDENDFRPNLTLAKARGSDAYVFLGYTEIQKALYQAEELGIEPPYYGSNRINQLIDGSEWPEAIYITDFTILDGNQVKAAEFIQAYTNIYGITPLVTWTAMQAYDAATLLFKAIQQASYKKGNFTDTLRNELLGTTHYEGVSGNIVILPTGASRGIYFSLYQLKDGEIVPPVAK